MMSLTVILGRAAKGAGAIFLGACLLLLFPANSSARDLDEPGVASRWAFVETRAAVYARPDMRSRIITRLSPRTNKGTTELVHLLEDRVGPTGRIWVRASLPIRPLNTTGWIQAHHLSEYHFVKTRLIVKRSTQTLRLVRAGRVIFRARVGVGRPRTPTPAGEFYIRMKLTNQRGIYGPLAFGTSALSNVHLNWPGGGYIGIHGTDQPQLIPGRISNGCIRMRNSDIRALARLMPVGTPLSIL